MAAEILQRISKDEVERAHFRSRKKAEMDRVHNMLTSEEIGEMREREKWQVVVSEKDALIAANQTEIEMLRSQIAELQLKNR